MTFTIAYEVFLALSEEEKRKFLLHINEHFDFPKKTKRKKPKIEVLKKEDAINYLIKNIFCKKTQL